MKQKERVNMLRVRITAIDNESISGYTPEQLEMSIPDFPSLRGCPSIPEWVCIRERAIAVLWDHRWTPGSVAWKVIDEQGQDYSVGLDSRPIGENYGS